jgi:hypothetical protein
VTLFKGGFAFRYPADFGDSGHLVYEPEDAVRRSDGSSGCN